MRYIRCDRCEKEMTTDEDLSGWGFVRMTRGPLGETAAGGDLCPVCAGLLIEFIGAETVPENDSAQRRIEDFDEAPKGVRLPDGAAMLGRTDMEQEAAVPAEVVLDAVGGDGQ